MNSPGDSIPASHRAAQQAMREGNLRAAHQHCLAILELDPAFADAWFLCAVIAAENGQVKKAVEILERAILLAPKNPEYQAEIAKHLLALHQVEEALHHATIAFEQAPAELPTLNTLGTVFTRAGEHQPALMCYERANELLKKRGGKSNLPANWLAELHFNRAASLQFSGKFQESEAAYEKAIALDPELFKAHSALSTLRRQTEDNNHLARLQSLRNAVKTPRDRLHLGHAIAKELEDMEQYAESLATLQWAKELQAADVGYSFANDAALFSTLLEVFPAQRPQASSATGYPSREPVFVVGMPRTGTTLVEQIVSSHSDVFAAGELQNFPLQVKRKTQTPSSEVLDLQTLRAAGGLDMAELGRAYIRSTRPRTGQTPKFIDKLPLNFLYIGLICQALPEAKIICLRRDAMDTCLSNYRQLFAVDFRHYHYNYDLLTCGQYYMAFDSLMQHWHAALPGRIHDVRYESLVTEPEATARDLIAFCELDWEPACLNFHQRQTSVATPSAVQVRQGIYQTSVNRWRRYGSAMQPLYDLLQAAGFYPD